MYSGAAPLQQSGIVPASGVVIMYASFTRYTSKRGPLKPSTERRVMRENAVLKKMRGGGTSVGSWVGIESPLSTEIMAGAGFEWLMIDGEHGPITGNSVINLIN